MTVSVATQWDGSAAAVAIAGDVDLSSVAPVAAAVEAAICSADAASVEVDLSEVTFLDSSGISVLVRGRRIAEEHGVEYRVVGASGLVLTVLELTGVWAHLSGLTG